MTNRYDQTKDGRTGRPVPPKGADEHSNDGQADQGPSGERPEALAQFAESAREDDDGRTAPKDLTADHETAPMPTRNQDKHDVATRLLNEGAHGEEPDPQEAGADKLPDRIVDSRSAGKQK